MKIKNILSIALCAVIIFGYSAFCFFGEKATFSDSERRALASFPEVNIENIISGDFAKEFESYAVDAFPMRDSFRTLKAYTRLYAFLQSDNNGLYEKGDHLSKLEYPEIPEMREHAVELFTAIYEKYLKNCNVYFTMIPDKNMFLADLKIDYKAFAEKMAKELDFAENIDITDLLSADDYYNTDTHWKQQSIVDIAERLAESMGADIEAEYEEVLVKDDFDGVYVGQSALPVEPDELVYLTNDEIKGYTVGVMNDSGKLIKTEGAYDMVKAEGKDPYEMFLSGTQSVVKIVNPAEESGKKLVIFRDSFGSSIAPLLAQGYSEIMLIDLRYIGSEQIMPMLGDLNGVDVLFMYSTLLLNNSLSMK